MKFLSLVALLGFAAAQDDDGEGPDGPKGPKGPGGEDGEDGEGGPPAAMGEECESSQQCEEGTCCSMNRDME